MKTLTWVTAILLVSTCVGCASSPPPAPPGPGWTRTETGPGHVPSRKPATYPTQRQRYCRGGEEPDGYGGCKRTVDAIIQEGAWDAFEGAVRQVGRKAGGGVGRMLGGY